MFVKLLAIGIGGALGALSRYGLTILATKLWGDQYPWGTLGVNLIGCFLIGLLISLGGEQEWLSVQTRLMVITGFLGALTTFSSYSIETVSLIHKGATGLAILNVLLNNGVGLAMVVGGMWLGGIFVKLH